MRKMYVTIRYKWLTNQISGLALKTNIHKQIGLIYEGKWKIVEDRHDSKKETNTKPSRLHNLCDEWDNTSETMVENENIYVKVANIWIVTTSVV